ncbi:MAG: ParA family protein, partial [Nitrospinota bacterium]
MARVENTGNNEYDTVISLDGSSEACIVGVTGSGGGVGKSTLVAHAASALAKSGQKVLVIDLNSGSNGAANMLGMNGNAARLSAILSSSNKLPEEEAQTSVPNVSFASA